MVRLKVVEFKRSATSRIISIPYGSIKRCPRLWPWGLQTRFQFLMVRLKDADAHGWGGIEQFQFLMVRLKVTTPSARHFRPPWFQFLMVRLKGTASASCWLENLISIPYGSIKRLKLMNRLFWQLLFQFLMVRLKVVEVVQVFIVLLSNFNSLWFD